MATRNRLYPHLLDPDIDIWEEFLSAHGSAYTHFDYDVRVGEGRDPGDLVNSKFRKVGIELSKRRIDAVGFRPGTIDIIEITVYADFKALGQLLAYPELYRSTFKRSIPIRPVLVCREIAPDLQQAITDNNITVRLFPEK
jgi:hypothetical protein